MKKIHKLTYKYEIPNYPEEFKVITYPDIKSNKYIISTYGRVINIKTKKEMKTYFDDDDHEKITLVTIIPKDKKNGYKSKHYFIHRLMAWEFLGKPKDDIHNYVNHKNGIPCCNLIHNLEWCSVLENTEHAKNNNLLNNAGLNCVSCIYSEKLIREICSMIDAGIKNKVIIHNITEKYKEFNWTYNKAKQLVSKIHRKIIFHDIVSEYNFKSSIPLIDKDVKNNIIRKLIYHDKTNYEIMKYFGFDDVSKDKKLYNRIIYQRSICKMLFNDYRKDELDKIFGTE